MKSKYTLKTQPTNKDPMQIIAAIPNESKQADAKILLEVFTKAVGKPPVVWGKKFFALAPTSTAAPLDTALKYMLPAFP